MGDLDNDGDLDAFVVNGGQPNQVWLNNGSGSLGNNGQSLGNAECTDVALGDLDADGDLDAFVGNGSSVGRVNKTWLNDGAGLFSDSGQSIGAFQSKGVALGDIDGDNDLDVVVANELENNKIWLNNGSGAFTDSGELAGVINDSWDVDVMDVDGDGDLDLFFALFVEVPQIVYERSHDARRIFERMQVQGAFNIDLLMGFEGPTDACPIGKG